MDQPSLNPVRSPRPAAGLSDDPADRLIVALDFASARDALRLTDELGDRCRWVKVGMELFYAEGKDVIRQLQARNYHIFLDLKLHDIPNTVASAIRSVSQLGVDLLTVHAGGGEAMLRASASAASTLPKPPRLAAVTVLTSMDEHQLLGTGVPSSAKTQVTRLAGLALESGLDALVASPLEVRLLRESFGSSPLLIVPGIRLEESVGDDQNRIATPRAAIADGASLLVVGRPITQSADPARSLDHILEGIASGLEDQRSSKRASSSHSTGVPKT